MATIGPKKIGLINKGFFTRKYMAVFARQPEKVAVRRVSTVVFEFRDFITEVLTVDV